MKKLNLFLFIFIIFLHCCVIGFAQQKVPSIVWQKTLGGSDVEVMTSLVTSANKTFVVCGYSKSDISGNKTEASFGGYDFWVVKMDAAGRVIWTKTFGGNKDDFGASVIQTSDGGYLVGGTSLSDKTGSKSDTSVGHSSDYWVIKLDVNGNKIWDRTLGGLFTDKLTSMTELPTGGYVIGGYSYSDKGGIKNSNNLGSENNGDYWIVIIDTNGKIVTQEVTGGTSQDVLTCVTPVSNTGFYSAGYSYSLKLSGYRSQPTSGNCDYWITRSDVNGQQQADYNFGGDRSDYLSCMQVLADTSLLLGGYSNSTVSASKTSAFLGNTDYWLVKLNTNGKKQWDKTIGSTLSDYLVSIQQTLDHGYLLGGYSNSNKGNDKTEDSRGGYDYWIVKTDSAGNVQWDKTIGGSGDDKLAGAYQIDSNQYIIAGTSSSGKSGDKDTSAIGSAGASDFWVLQLGDSVNVPIDTTVDTTTVPPIDTSRQPPAGNGSARGIYNINILPNPLVDDQLSFQYSSNDNAITPFVMYSYDGKKVLSVILNATRETQVFTTSVATLPKGIYYLTMYGKKGKVTKMIVKM